MDSVSLKQGVISDNEVGISNKVDFYIICGNIEDKSRSPCQDILRLTKEYEKECYKTRWSALYSDKEYPLLVNKSKQCTYGRRKICKTEPVEENVTQPEAASTCQIVDIQNILSVNNTTQLSDSFSDQNADDIRISTNTEPPVPSTDEFIKLEIDPLDLNHIDLLEPASRKVALPSGSGNNYQLAELLDEQVAGNISYSHTNCSESENNDNPMQGIRHNPSVYIFKRSRPNNLPKERALYIPPVVVCDICDLDFIGKPSLNSHLRLVHRPWALEILNEVYCPQCKVWFDDEFKFKVHFPCYKKAVRIRCPLCSMENPLLEHYDLHNVLYRNGNYLWCTLCETPTRYTVAELNEHRQTEHEENGAFECLECKQTFGTYSEVKAHSVQHEIVDTIQHAMTYKLQVKEERKESFNCDICDRTFLKHRYMIKHRQSHDKALCSVCGLSFKNNCLLVEHQNKHFKSQIYTCEECGKEFDQRKYLAQHVRIHKVKKMFECEICNTTFTQQTSLIYHMATHTNENIFKCTVCDIKFDKQSKLSSHMQIHNADGTNPNQCKICKKYFAHNCNLIVHMRMHPEWKKEDNVKQINTNEQEREDSMQEINASEQEKENKKDENKKRKVTVKKQKVTKKRKSTNKK